MICRRKIYFFQGISLIESTGGHPGFCIYRLMILNLSVGNLAGWWSGFVAVTILPDKFFISINYYIYCDDQKK